MAATDTMLMAYVDGELDAAGMQEVERLLATDAEARRTVAMYRETAALLRAACGEAVYAAGAARILPQARPRAWPRRRLVWAAAASVLLGAGLGAGGTVLGTRQSAMATLIDEIAEYHAVLSREPDHLAEVPAARGEEFAAWLGARLQRHLDVPDLASLGLRYAGGRMLVVDGAPVAQFMYTRTRGLPIAVCVARAEGSARPLETERRGALRVAAWRQDGYAYVIVGDMPAELARTIANEVRAQLRA